jgi:hypothetical protein
MEGFFTKLIYSDSFITMSGLYIHFPIHIKSIFKQTAFFDMTENKETIDEIVELEKNILNYYRERQKNKNVAVSSVKKQFMTGMVKLNYFASDTNSNMFQMDNKCIIKISGIWENNDTIGLAYKFLQYKPLHIS